MHTFVFDGSGSTASIVGSIFTSSFSTYIFYVSVYYGDLVSTEGSYPLTGTIAPRVFPVLPNVKIDASWNDTSGVVGKMSQIYRQDLFDTSGNCLGARFLFSTGEHAKTDGGLTFVWGMPEIEVPYGVDLIKIQPLSGTGGTFGFSD